MQKFSNLYPTNKTLKFSLIPQKETEENFTTKKLLEEDTKRKKNYSVVKQLMNNYHRDFINQNLNSFEFSSKNLTEYSELFNKASKNTDDQKKFESIQTLLRTEITDHFEKDEKYKKLFSKPIFDLLLEHHKNTDQIEHIKEFKNFSSYFTGFFKNRKNIYSNKAQSSSIAYRIVHDNLPIFLRNMRIYDQFKSNHLDLIASFKTNEYKAILSQTNVAPTVSLDLDTILSDIQSINQFLTQSGINFYNSILGGYKDDHKKASIEGLNQKINASTQSSERIKLTHFKKQILSEKSSFSKTFEEFKNDDDVYESIKDLYEHTHIAYESISNLILEISNSDLSKIYIAFKQLNDLSSHWLGDWDELHTCFETYHKDHDFKSIKKPAQLDKKITTKWKQQKSVSLSDLNKWTQYTNPSQDIITYISTFKLTKTIEALKSSFQDLIENRTQTINETPRLIKAFLDTALTLYHHFEWFKGSGEEPDRDPLFYGQFSIHIQPIEDCLFATYNKTRNYITQKPYSLEKIKLNFQNPTFLNGWDVNKEESNLGTLLLKDGLYYLVIFDKKHKKILTKIPKNSEKTNFSTYQKMNLKYLPSPNKMLPKVFFSKKKP